jgi:cysteine desulfurase
MDIENYFDYAAATPMLPEVVTAMQPYFSEQFYNPSALYIGARTNRLALDEARHTIAKGLGARPTEIIFTAGGTEANNMALHGILSQFSDAHFITSAIEHDSILQPATQYNTTYVGVNDKGIIDVTQLTKAITDTTVLVSVMLVNNEVGAIQPLHDIVEVVNTVRKQRQVSGNTMPLYIHTDACQATNYLDIQVARLGVDLLTLNAGKLYGPKQCGALFVRAGIVLTPLIHGGGQEWNLRSGTENLANIVGFATAWKRIRGTVKEETKRVTELRDALIQGLTSQRPDCVINGPHGNRRIANNVHVTFPGKDNERILMELDEAGVQVATGSACSASNDEPSHVLKAMGLSDEAAQSSIRITLGRYTTEQSIENLLQLLAKK